MRISLNHIDAKILQIQYCHEADLFTDWQLCPQRSNPTRDQTFVYTVLELTTYSENASSYCPTTVSAYIFAYVFPVYWFYLHYLLIFISFLSSFFLCLSLIVLPNRLKGQIQIKCDRLINWFIGWLMHIKLLNVQQDRGAFLQHANCRLLQD